MTVITNKASFPNGVVVEDTNLVEFALTIPTSDKIFSLQDVVFLLNKFSFLDKSARILNINKCFPKMSHGVGKSKKKSHSMPKMVKLAIVWKPEVCSLIVLQGRTKKKSKNSNETFLVIFKQSVTLNLKTYTCGWDGSSPSDTESPAMSLKHFWQKLYRSATRVGVGFLKKKHKVNSSTCQLLKMRSYLFSKTKYLASRWMVQTVFCCP